MKIALTINATRHEVEISPSETLLDLVRRLGYKSVKFGCGEGACGACTVILDGRPVNACLVLAASVEGREVVTLEALGDTRRPHPLQEAFIEAGAVQCGFCTPGMILSAKALLDRNPDPGEDEIREAIDGNLCRCTGYVQIIEAVKLAAKRLKKGGAKSPGRRAKTGSR
jgi:carbon-monoxide dehydrogenase small subunit